jgi:hypothetical protein
MNKLSIIGKFFGAIGIIGAIGAIGAISAINLIGIHELNYRVKKLNDNTKLLNNNTNLLIIYITYGICVNSFIHNYCKLNTTYDETFIAQLLHNLNNFENVSMISVVIDDKQIIVNYQIFGQSFTYYYYYNNNKNIILF